MKIVASLLNVICLTALLHGQELGESTVGMSKRINGVVIAGSRVEPKPIEDRKTPIIIRIIKSSAVPEGFSYDFDYYGLEPGQHDLSQYLRRVDGTTSPSLPPIIVKVVPVLPPGQIQPNQLTIERSPWLGGYRLLVIVAISVWVIGLLAIILSFFFPRSRPPVVSSDKPLTLADQLRPLIEQALAGQLSHPQLSRLERGLYYYWRTRLNLQHASPDEAMQKLQTHAEAGPLLRQLEDWLHNPNPGRQVNVEALLKPYQSLEPEKVSTFMQHDHPNFSRNLS